MKSIIITGKHNQDKINNIKNPIREAVSKYSFNISQYDHNKQVNILNNLYLENEIDNKKDIISILNKKIQGYKSQDKQKNVWSQDEFITQEQCIEALVGSKLHCHYCNSKILFLYDKVGEKKQWTLDRIDNNLGHNRDNVVISCLGCNLQKRRRGEEAFKFMKQMVIKKCE